jgi:hypothetical protein
MTHSSLLNFNLIKSTLTLLYTMDHLVSYRFYNPLITFSLKLTVMNECRRTRGSFKTSSKKKKN